MTKSKKLLSYSLVLLAGIMLGFFGSRLLPGPKLVQAAAEEPEQILEAVPEPPDQDRVESDLDGAAETPPPPEQASDITDQNIALPVSGPESESEAMLEVATEFEISRDDIAVPVTFRISSSLSGSGEFYYAVAPAGSPAESWGTDSVIVMDIIKNGIYTVYLKDGQENVISKDVELITVDQKPPVIRHAGVENEEGWYLDNTLTVEATDATDLQYRFSNQKTGTDSDWQAAPTYDITENGSWQVSVRDAAGNESMKEIEVTNLDHEQPVILKVDVGEVSEPAMAAVDTPALETTGE